MLRLTSLKPRCRADNELVVITALFLTDEHVLLIHGYCHKCLRDIYIPIPLTDLRDCCPGPMDYGPEDLAVLHALGCCLPEPTKLISS
jgi:hypothetical protein